MPAKEFFMRISVSRHSEYCIFRVKNSPCWQAKFWNYEKASWACRRSTGVPLGNPKATAEKVARQLLTAGVLTQARGTRDSGFIAYLQDFWRADGEYCRQAATVKGKPLSPTYVKTNQGDIRLHIATYKPFAKMRLAAVTAGDIEKWQLWAREQHGISGSRVNHCLKLVKIAMTQAVRRGLIPTDCTKGIARAAEAKTEKGILTQAEAGAVCALPLDNPRRLLPVLLGLCCGMRRGEVRGLQWGDLQGGIIDIRHNWVDDEGLKTPKCGSFRKVPYGAAVSACLDAVRATARHIGGADFVLESLRMDGEPVVDEYFNKVLVSVLADIGISPEAQKRRNITPHSLRHSFISLARLAGVDPLIVQTLAGHSDIAMTDHYTHAAQAMDYEAVRAKFRLIA
jgi:integrase